MNDTDVIRRLMLAIERLEQSASQQAELARKASQSMHQIQVAGAELSTLREAEEAKMNQAMRLLFQQQQQKTEAALRPVIGRAWVGLIAVTAGFILVYLGFLFLLNHEYRRLRDAEARANAAELSVEVRQAMQHVEITSCGGRPCIQLEKDSPTWQSRGKDFILVDGKGKK